MIREAGNPDLLPQLVRFVVVAEDRHPDPILRQADRLSQKFPAERDGVFLKVVAEGKVPQHFKERMVASGIADILQIVVLAPRTETLLHGDRSLVGARFLAEKHPLKLVHPGIGEEQRGIGLRNQGGTRHGLMAMLFEISNEGLSQFLSAVLHASLTSSRISGPITVSMVSSSNPRWLKSLATRPGVCAEVVRPAIVTTCMARSRSLTLR